MSSDSITCLAVTVHLERGRFHGSPEWPPAPARFFQAMVAAAHDRGVVPPASRRSLEWLETRAAPLIAAPRATRGQSVKLFVPNNDLDAKGGDPARVAGIRTSKRLQPRIFDPAVPVLYVWPGLSPADAEPAGLVCELALRLYQLGRGVDMAWATGRVLSQDETEGMLDAHPGVVYRPARYRHGTTDPLPCPHRGSLASLDARYEATLARFADEPRGRGRVRVFQQPPKPSFRPVEYDTPVARALFCLRPPGVMGALASTPMVRIVALTEALRDAAAARLATALPREQSLIERAIVGRPSQGIRLAPTSRVRLVALPSIGHADVDRRVRRAMVEVPADCPLPAGDVFWAFSGLELRGPAGSPLVATRADDHGMLRHYGIVQSDGHAVVWRSVTPLALPVRRSGASRTAGARTRDERQARRAVLQALRHAGVRARPSRVVVQREPFERRGTRAERFATGTRFTPSQLWHVELRFQEPVSGPLVVGDGRFLGLGLMAPSDVAVRALAYDVVSGLRPGATPLALCRALRRAVMARCQAELGDRHELPSFVSGHAPDGGPANAARNPHLHYAFVPAAKRLYILCPSLLRHERPRRSERRHWRTLLGAMSGFGRLRAGRAGDLSLASATVEPTVDSLLARSRVWRSLTPYVVNRHHRVGDARNALALDLRAACGDAGLSEPNVEVTSIGRRKGPLRGMASLTFAAAIQGPLLLGRTRHLGGGLFVPHPMPA